MTGNFPNLAKEKKNLQIQETVRTPKAKEIHAKVYHSQTSEN